MNFPLSEWHQHCRRNGASISSALVQAPAPSATSTPTADTTHITNSSGTAGLIWYFSKTSGYGLIDQGTLAHRFALVAIGMLAGIVLVFVTCLLFILIRDYIHFGRRRAAQQDGGGEANADDVPLAPPPPPVPGSFH